MVPLTAEETDFLRAFEDGSLPVDEFDHEAHVHAAWCCLDRYGRQEGTRRFRTALMRLVRLHGAEDKYHETMTTAFLELIEHRRRKDADWPSFRRQNRELLDRGLDVLLSFYSRERLFSDQARQTFIGPDRGDLPGTGSDMRAAAMRNAPAKHQRLTEIPGIGPKLAQALVDLGFSTVPDLRGANPEQMYASLCDLRGVRVDRCVLYAFRCAVYFAENREHDPDLLKWWRWKDR